MTSVNTKIADAAIGHQVDLLRVEAGLRRDVLTLMQALSGDLAATLAKAGEWDAESIPLKLKRLQGLKGQTDGLIGDLYAKLETDTLTEMKDAATFAAQWAPQAINAAVGVDIAAITLTPQLLNNLVKNTLVEGAPSAQWWSRQSDSLKMDFSREMRMGILQGENLGDLTRRIRGRKENGYADGLLPPAADAGRGGSRTARAATTKATRAAEGLALTSVQQVMSDARMEAYQQNADIIKGVQQLSTLDGRTSATCRGLDHAARALDGSPLPGLPLLPSGGPPWHWRCRSVLIPLTKSWAELGIKGQKEIPPGTRASMDGQVPETMDYGTWLKSKPEAFQKEVLGKGRFELWRDGKADLKDMVDQRGRPVKVRELASVQAPPPKPQYVPQKDVAAAAKYAMDNNLADVARYKGADIAVANAWNQSIFDHLQEFPELRPNFKFIGTTQEAQRYFVEEYMDKYLRPHYGSIYTEEQLLKNARKQAGKTPGNVMAYSYGDKYRKGIAVNSKYAADFAQFEATTKRCVDTGFHPVGAEHVKSVVDHEVAHQLDALLGIRNNPKLAQIIANHTANGDTVEKLVSKYAKESTGELIAEAWSEYRNNPFPRSLSSEIAKLIQDEYTIQYGGITP